MAARPPHATTGPGVTASTGPASRTWHWPASPAGLRPHLSPDAGGMAGGRCRIIRRMSAPGPGGNPEENARCRRTIRAAEELFKKAGFRAVTMELVAREANVAKATLYSYFKNKDELFLAVCARM